jgi:hypothetical protein
MLPIRADAGSAADLTQIREQIKRRLAGFGRRERMTVTWQPAPDLPDGMHVTMAG